MQFKWVIFLGFLTIANTAYAKDVTKKQRDLFLKTEYAAKKPMKRGYFWLKKQLGDYPLAPYVELDYLKSRAYYSREKEITAFLAKYEGSPVDKPLRKKWLKYLAKKDYGKTFLRDYKYIGDTALACHNLRFKLKHGATHEEIMPLVDKLWIVGKSQPKACDPLFAKWRQLGHRTPDKVWERIVLAAEGGKHTLIPYLKKLLPKNEKYLADLYYKVRRSPSQVSRLKLFPNKNSKELDIVKYAIKRLAWRKRELALKTWPKLNKKFKFSAAQKNDIVRTFAISLSSAKHKKAGEWLAKVPKEVLDDSLVQWRIADTLRNKDWNKALDILSTLPTDLSKKESWQYWKARGLAGIGQAQLSKDLYTQLSQKRHYYGFLAAGKVGGTPKLVNQPITPTEAIIAKIDAMPAMQRAKELFALKRYSHARREWNFLKSQLDGEGRLAAAKLSNTLGWYDRAIFMLAEEKMFNDVALRFPLAYEKSINQLSSRNKIEPAWTYAIARRESSFMSDANSGAGAIGLMQVLPTTAKYVAKKDISRRQLFNPKTNINYGTKYLHYLMNKADGNTVVATAAYNAGIHRVKKWLPKNEGLAADIWIETIPYKETRDYVKAVMAYKQIYTYLLGGKENLFDDIVAMEIQK